MVPLLYSRTWINEHCRRRPSVSIPCPAPLSLPYRPMPIQYTLDDGNTSRGSAALRVYVNAIASRGQESIELVVGRGMKICSCALSPFAFFSFSRLFHLFPPSWRGGWKTEWLCVREREREREHNPWKRYGIRPEMLWAGEEEKDRFPFLFFFSITRKDRCCSGCIFQTS